MKRLYCHIEWSLLGLVLLLAAGCGRTERAGDRPATAPTTGTVTYQGQPLADAMVTFHPQSAGASGGQNRGAVGKTDASGNFALTTFEPQDGAIPGKYRVTVTKTEGGAPAENPDPFAPAAPAPKSLVPQAFTKPDSSGLTAEVKQGGENKFSFDLGK